MVASLSTPPLLTVYILHPPSTASFLRPPSFFPSHLLSPSTAFPVLYMTPWPSDHLPFLSFTSPPPLISHPIGPPPKHHCRYCSYCSPFDHSNRFNQLITLIKSNRSNHLPTARPLTDPPPIRRELQGFPTLHFTSLSILPSTSSFSLAKST